MGILDDAIREHLSLKRRQGADDDELKRLEDEAFGPPSRPGEPDFPEAGASAAEAPAAEGVAVEEPPRDPAPEPEPEQVADAAAPAEAPPEEPEPPASAEAEGGEDGDGEEAEPGEFYDQGSDELDLELELDDEEPIGEPEQPPIESLDTVEHHVEDALPPETGEQEAAARDAGEEIEFDEDEDEDEDEHELAEDEELLEGEIADEDQADEDDDEDVLEETPEFLRDAPEDDELWFEQGKPKDFDF